VKFGATAGADSRNHHIAVGDWAHTRALDGSRIFRVCFVEYLFQEDEMARKIFYQQERLAMFIDGANLYAAARSLGFDIDYKRLLELFAAEGRLIRAFYYTALVEDQEYSPIRPLVDWLDYNGYTMVTKPTKEFTDASGRRKIKGNMDIELAIDVMEMAERVDHILLFSGDGDFRRLVEAVQRKGVRVTVISTVRSTPPMVADELRRQADNFLELQDLAGSIQRSHGPRYQQAPLAAEHAPHDDHAVQPDQHHDPLD
jgi:uncharacterized LabA/DUF88 family protein